jgi:hypothetical protein
MGILRSIVEAFVLSMLQAGQQLLFGCPIARQLIGDHDRRDVLTGREQLTKNLLGGLFVWSALHKNIQSVAMLINCAPEIVQLAVEKHRCTASQLE